MRWDQSLKVCEGNRLDHICITCAVNNQYYKNKIFFFHPYYARPEHSIWFHFSSIILHRLSTIGITQILLAWFNSYLSVCTYFIQLNSFRSHPYSEVPQGSIFRKFNIKFHYFADDTQLYHSTKPFALLPPHSLISSLSDVRSWFSSNFLQLNSDKTKLGPYPLYLNQYFFT